MMTAITMKIKNMLKQKLDEETEQNRKHQAQIEQQILQI